MEIRQRIAVILCLGIGLASSGLTVAQSSPGLGQAMSHADREPSGLHDFDFYSTLASPSSKTALSNT